MTSSKKWRPHKLKYNDDMTHKQTKNFEMHGSFFVTPRVVLHIPAVAVFFLTSSIMMLQKRYEYQNCVEIPQKEIGAPTCLHGK